MLEETGFVTLEAASGNEAISIAANRKNEIDLVLTDVMMPGIDGFQLGARIAGVSRSIPVMYMTGYADPVAAGANSFGPSTPAGMVQKPFTRTILLNAVHRAMTPSSRVSPVPHIGL